MIGAVHGERNLVRAPESFRLETVDGLGAGPPLGAAQDDHRPARGLLRSAMACRLLDRSDRREGGVQCRRHGLVHQGGIVARDDDRRVAVAAQERQEIVLRDPGEDGGIGDLVAVQMQDRQYRAVARRVEELVAVPGGRERPGLGLAVADDAGDDEVGIVERRAIGMRQGIAELAALVDGTRRVGGGVAGDAAGKRELAEQASHAGFVLRDVGIDLAVGSFEPGVGDHPRRAVAGPGDEQDVGILRLDDPVEMDIDEVQAGHRAPMAEKAWLDMRHLERRAQQRIGHQIDLPDRQVVGGAPPGVRQAERLGREGAGRRVFDRGVRHRFTPSVESLDEKSGWAFGSVARFSRRPCA